ncbi:TPA: hypothetical protein HA235_00425 [Candidatus Woesearchaeota archaeon]|nr:hypothetical protein [Candidatus Woesearchaeota archaeon]HIH31149.1 hypothetical protein [Candidatus Woesearchaeota archaeon]HIH54630.1 hypothetical protein [Candidatus Woesearchaeota archaeon]HIJ02317.1 hypothetical protein [Candidatus Woesearchaeota archaeon]HIJ14206.1 hypothetical protein [Candidatus Woesearchaeota archaeon]
MQKTTKIQKTTKKIKAKMDDSFPVRILDDVVPRDIPREEMINVVFRRRSIENGEEINEIAFNPETYNPEYINDSYRY